MKTIDFDRQFRLYVMQYMQNNPGLKEDEAEDLADKLYAEWENAPADWLDGASPRGYFRAVENAEELTEALEKYCALETDVPELLLDRIVEMGEGVHQALFALYSDENKSDPVRTLALSLLSETAYPDVKDICVLEVLSSGQASEKSDMAVDILSWGCEKKHLDRLLSAFQEAPEYAKMLILEIACNYPGEECIYTYTVDRLLNDPEHRAIYASDLAKLGDERAIEPLKRLTTLSDLTYYDYLELRDAIEALGGELEIDRAFYGDPDYEAMRNL